MSFLRGTVSCGTWTQDRSISKILADVKSTFTTDYKRMFHQTQFAVFVFALEIFLSSHHNHAGAVYLSSYCKENYFAHFCLIQLQSAEYILSSPSHLQYIFPRWNSFNHNWSPLNANVIRDTRGKRCPTFGKYSSIYYKCNSHFLYLLLKNTTLCLWRVGLSHRTNTFFTSQDFFGSVLLFITAGYQPAAFLPFLLTVLSQVCLVDLTDVNKCLSTVIYFYTPINLKGISKKKKYSNIFPIRYSIKK